MARNTVRLAMTATFVGGPRDGDIHPRPTSRWALFKPDRGERMGQITQRKAWHEPLAQFRYPTAGYKLHEDHRFEPPRAHYVHSSVWHEWNRQQDEKHETIADKAWWKINVEKRIEVHKLDPLALDIAPMMLSYLVEQFDAEDRSKYGDDHERAAGVTDAETWVKARHLDYIRGLTEAPEVADWIFEPDRVSVGFYAENWPVDRSTE